MSPRRLSLGVVLYGAMAVLGVALGLGRGEPLLARAPAMGDLGADPLIVSLGLGLALALTTTASTRWLVGWASWARTLRAQMRPFLAGASPLELALLALLSGVAEELFFRGALQPWVGLTASSLAFGLLHIGPTRAFLPWTLWAVVMGFLFGAITLVTGQLAGAIVAHVAINAVNLRLVADYDGALDVPTSRAPGLVDRRRRASSEHATGHDSARRLKVSPAPARVTESA